MSFAFRALTGSSPSSPTQSLFPIPFRRRSSSSPPKRARRRLSKAKRPQTKEESLPAIPPTQVDDIVADIDEVLYHFQFTPRSSLDGHSTSSPSTATPPPDTVQPLPSPATVCQPDPPSDIRSFSSASTLRSDSTFESFTTALTTFPSASGASLLHRSPTIHRKPPHSLRHKLSPEHKTLRDLRAEESEACLRRAYEEQVNSYLEGSWGPAPPPSPGPALEEQDDDDVASFAPQYASYSHYIQSFPPSPPLSPPLPLSVAPASRHSFCGGEAGAWRTPGGRLIPRRPVLPGMVCV